MKRKHSAAAAAASLPWEVVPLMCEHFDPKTLSIASCVSKSWNRLSSSEFFWKRLCHRHYPSLTKLIARSNNGVVDDDHPEAAAAAPTAAFSYRSLYVKAFSASKRTTPVPSKPRLSLNDLVFAIDLHSVDGRSGLVTPSSVIKPCSELKVDRDGLFRFDVVVGRGEEDVESLKNKAGDGVKATWNVVNKGWKIFTMIHAASKQTNSGEGLEEVFTNQLPATSSCFSAVESSGIMAEFRLKFGGDQIKNGKARLEKITLGLMNTHSWRYVSVDDGLRYLQDFFDRENKSSSLTTTKKKKIKN